MRVQVLLVKERHLTATPTTTLMVANAAEIRAEQDMNAELKLR